MQRSTSRFSSTAGIDGGALLELRNVSKRFPGVCALDQVNFDLRAGEVHALFGENGAGKSTLISIVAGAIRPSEGDVLVGGKPVELHSVRDARELGISAVFQEFSLVPTLTVADNLLLGSEPGARGFIDRRTLRADADRLLRDLGFPLKASQQVSRLSRAQQQMVEIAKAFRSDLRVLILDEPTASLTETEAGRLFELVQEARGRGIGVIYVTHRLKELYRLADRVTVLRDGQYVDTLDQSDVSEDRLLRLMTGRVIEQVFPDIDTTPEEVVLSARDLTTVTRSIRNVDFEVRAGEIVGFAGLVGSGKSSAARACFGAEAVLTGAIELHGRDVTGSTPRQMLRNGMFYVPSDRKADGLLMMRSVRENVALPCLSLDRFSKLTLLRRAVEREVTDEVTRRVRLHPHALERPVEQFSGGNQQKVLLARALTRDVDVFVFDEPTVGVDVGTRVAIYNLVAELCAAGAAVVLVSSDLPEILHLTHRAYVFHQGRVVDHLVGEEITEENVLRNFLDEGVA